MTTSSMTHLLASVPPTAGIVATSLLVTLIPAVALLRWARRKAKQSCLTELAQWLASFLIIGGFMWPFVLYPVMRSAREASVRTTCLSRLNQIGKAMLMYSGDNDDRMPKSANWCDALAGYGVDGFACPALKDNPYGYWMNAQVSGFRYEAVAEPATVVSAFDAPGGKNRAGGEGDLRFHPVSEITCIVFSDQHTKVFSRENYRHYFEGMRWNPVPDAATPTR